MTDVSLHELDTPPTIEPPRRLTKKGGLTLQRIKTAARELLRENGFALTRTHEIAQRAGLSNGAFYRYFKDKTAVTVELLQELLADAFTVTRSSLANTDIKDPGSSLALGTRNYLDFYSTNRDLFRVLVEMSQTDPDVEQLWARFRTDTINRLSTALRRGIDSGHFRADLDTELAATLLTAMTDHYAYLSYVLNRTPERDIDSACQEITVIWLHGIGSKAALAPSRNDAAGPSTSDDDGPLN